MKRSNIRLGDILDILRKRRYVHKGCRNVRSRQREFFFCVFLHISHVREPCLCSTHVFQFVSSEQTTEGFRFAGSLTSIRGAGTTNSTLLQMNVVLLYNYPLVLCTFGLISWAVIPCNFDNYCGYPAWGVRLFLAVSPRAGAATVLPLQDHVKTIPFRTPPSGCFSYCVR